MPLTVCADFLQDDEGSREEEHLRVARQRRGQGGRGHVWPERAAHDRLPHEREVEEAAQPIAAAAPLTRTHTHARGAHRYGVCGVCGYRWLAASHHVTSHSALDCRLERGRAVTHHRLLLMWSMHSSGTDGRCKMSPCMVVQNRSMLCTCSNFVQQVMCNHRDNYNIEL